MGRRGPKPTPTKKLQLRGSWRGETRDGEPEPDVSLPPCPDWVREDARKHWDKFGQTLYNLGIMSEAYDAAVALLANALAMYIDAEEAVQDSGFTSVTDSGNVIQHPNVGIRNKAWKQVLDALRELGLTPSAMTGIKTPEKPKKTGVDQFRLSQ